jgi:integrase
LTLKTIQTKKVRLTAIKQALQNFTAAKASSTNNYRKYVGWMSMWLSILGAKSSSYLDGRAIQELLSSRGYARGTQVSLLSFLRAALSSEGVSLVYPRMVYPKAVRKTHTTLAALGRVPVEKLRNHKLASAYIILKCFGLRTQDLWGLDFYFDQTSQNVGCVGVQGKTGKRLELLVKATPDIRKAVTDWCDHRESFSAAAFRKAWQREPLLTGATPHDLRRYVATQLAASKTPIQVIQQILNHSSARTTELYITTDSLQVSSALDSIR